ncbi:MAG: fimbrillin family protein [Bacteroidaceae bacterium]|nr:fimbrillin family protein [Bacteroidaceae bacterium]
MKKIVLLAAAALALASCDNNEDNQLTSTEAAKITATIGNSAVTRAADTEWAPGDQIGISSTIGVDETVPGPFINYKYTTVNGDGEFKGNPLFFYKPMTLVAYYPYAGVEGTAPGTNGFIEANTKPDNQLADNQVWIDFLWDSKTGIGRKDFSASDPNVAFRFSHKMSKLTFTFRKSDATYDRNNVLIAKGVDVSDMISYGIEGLGLVGTFDTATGVCAIDEEKEPRSTLTISFRKGTVENEKAMPSLIVFPQKQPEKGNFMLHITTDELGTDEAGNRLPEQKYNCALPFSDNEIKPGCHYKFTIQVTKVGLILGDMSIDEWEPAREWSGTATIDGDIFLTGK